MYGSTDMNGPSTGILIEKIGKKKGIHSVPRSIEHIQRVYSVHHVHCGLNALQGAYYDQIIL